MFEVCLQVLVLHLGGKENALPLAVRGRDGLQLEEVEEHLDLRGEDQVREQVQGRERRQRRRTREKQEV